jgi:integrase
MRLTKANVVKITLPPGKDDMLVFDESLPGFGIRVRAGGKRTWIAQYRLGTKQRRLSLGSFDKVDADEARKRARAALSRVSLGQDPQADRTSAIAKASVTLGGTFRTYLSRHGESRLKASSLEDVRRYMLVHWSPIHEIAVHSLTRSMVATRLAEIANANGPYAANRARAALSSFYSWAIGEGIADSNPVVGTNKATDEVSRNRVLSLKELGLVWRRTGAGNYGAIVKLLILTGQRREEVGGMLWSEVDMNAALWSIRPDRTKNGLPHDVPLSLPAIEILRSQQRRDDRDLIFGLRDGPFQGWSQAKRALDERIGPAVNEPWRLHDVRRTVATRLGDYGVLPHVVEAILNHISGHRAGVAGIYNRAAYAREKREALDGWGAIVSKDME